MFTSSQLFVVKPAGAGELNVYHEEDWMPGKNALIGSLKKQAGLPRSKVIGFWTAVSQQPVTPAVTVAECVDKQTRRDSGAAAELRCSTDSRRIGSFPLPIRPGEWRILRLRRAGEFISDHERLNASSP